MGITGGSTTRRAPPYYAPPGLCHGGRVPRIDDETPPTDPDRPDEATRVQVALPGGTFALQIRGGLVVDAPPMAQWAIGKPAVIVLDHLHRRGARIIP